MEGKSRLSLAERRARIAAAREALVGFDAELWQAPSGGGPDGLAGLLGEVDALGVGVRRGPGGGGREAMDRGETSGGPAAMTTAVGAPPRPLDEGRRCGPGGRRRPGVRKAVQRPVKHAVNAGRLPVRSAAVVVAEYDKACGRCWVTWRRSRP